MCHLFGVEHITSGLLESYPVDFTAKKLQREERPSIRKDIAASKEKAAARNADRAKEKFKERGLSR